MNINLNFIHIMPSLFWEVLSLMKRNYCFYGSVVLNTVPVPVAASPSFLDLIGIYCEFSNLSFALVLLQDRLIAVHPRTSDEKCVSVCANTIVYSHIFHQILFHRIPLDKAMDKKWFLWMSLVSSWRAADVLAQTQIAAAWPDQS